MSEQHLCDYGCGQIAIHQFGNGKWCCSESFNKCPIIRQKKSGKTAWNKGKVYTKEERQKMSLDQTGKKHSEKTKKKIGKGSIGRVVSKETRRKLSLSQKGISRPISTIIKNRLSLNKIKALYPLLFKLEEIRYNPNNPGEKELQCHCKNHECSNSKEKGGWFTPDRHKIFDRAYALNDQGGSYIYCSDKCKNECPLYRLRYISNQDKEIFYTAEEYQTWRREVLDRAFYKCEYCENDAIYAHHSRPQKLEPGFSLDPDFGIACCKSCHYKYGHETGTECSTGNLASTICR